MELDVHTHIEETIFYPNLKSTGDKDLVDMVLEGIEEHRQAKMFLKEISALSGDSTKFEPKLTVLIEDVEHHASEEESDMFPVVRDQFSSEALEDLAAAMEKEKRKFKKSLTAGA
jgi:iron-sulfur cluster repair protein YtfE (RIC family)